MNKDEHDSVTEEVIGAAIEVHRQLGPGLIESIYEEALCHELQMRSGTSRDQVNGLSPLGENDGTTG